MFYFLLEHMEYETHGNYLRKGVYTHPKKKYSITNQIGLSGRAQIWGRSRFHFPLKHVENGTCGK